MDIHEKTQEDLAAALISHNQTLRHGNVMSEGYIQELRGQKANTAQAAERARRQAWRDADSATREIAELKKTISEFSRIVQNKQDTIEAFQAALAERDELRAMGCFSNDVQKPFPRIWPIGEWRPSQGG